MAKIGIADPSASIVCLCVSIAVLRALKTAQHGQRFGELFVTCFFSEAGEFALDHDKFPVSTEHEFAVLDLNVSDAGMRGGKTQTCAGEKIHHRVG